MSDHPKRRASDNRVRKARKPRARPSEVAVERKTDVVTAGPGALLSTIMRLASQPDLRMDVLSLLLDKQEAMETQQMRALYTQAFVKMQMEMPRIKKNGEIQYPVDSNNPRGPKYTATHFAKWEDIDAVLRPIYTKHGFGLTFRIQQRTFTNQDGGAASKDVGGLIVTAILRHEAGHQEEATIPVPLDTSGGKNAIQAYGSSLSYGKRYSAGAVLNFVTEGEDDDGVKGGQTFITEAEVAELHALCQETGRREVDILRRMFGDTVLSFNELPPGTSFIAVKNTLLGIKQLQQERRQQGGAE